ncbi:MAG: nucleotidyltransferase domain-containing protein [Thermoanaerobacteraceae bacterium]|nr:nucleotidyltransferase domain-containing protein [Thermoanaerobacteraceae bacterium]
MSDDITSLREAWRRRAERERQAAVNRRREALAKARRAARWLKEKYGVNRVYLYGSLAWSRHFTPHSDIDLFVEGFTPKELYWRMWSEVEAITTPFPPSIVLAEDALPGLRDEVKKRGHEL